jgi:hypothetical protein
MSIGASTRWVLAPPTVGHRCLAAGGRGRPGREREEDQRAVPAVSVVSAPAVTALPAGLDGTALRFLRLPYGFLCFVRD